MTRHEQKEEHKKVLQLQLESALYRESFYEFFKKAVTVLRPNDDFTFNWHHQYLAGVLQQDVEQVIQKKKKKRDLLINIAPSTSKTLLLTCLQVWTWTVNPYHVFVFVSNSESLVNNTGADCLDLINSEWFKTLYPHIIIREDSSAKSSFKLLQGGARYGFTTGGKITGHHADTLIIDDLMDSKDLSTAKIQMTVDSWNAISTRVKNQTISNKIVIGQRLSENDITGYLLSKNENGKFYHICLPIELTDDVKPVELRKYYVDDLFWSSRFPRTCFSDLADTQYIFQTQYNQSPYIVDGGILKRSWFDEPIDLDLQPELAKELSRIPASMFIDTAMSSKNSADYTAILICKFYQNHLYIIDVIRKKLDFPDLVVLLKKLGVQYNNSRISIEGKSSGQPLIQTLRNETLLTVLEIQPKTDKVNRVMSISGKVQSRRVKLIKGRYVDDFLYEVCQFPNVKNDDQIDTLAYAVDSLLLKKSNLDLRFV